MFNKQHVSLEVVGQKIHCNKRKRALDNDQSSRKVKCKMMKPSSTHLNRVNRYFNNVCSNQKKELMLAFLNGGKLRDLANAVKVDPLYQHFIKLYGKENFSVFKNGDKFTYSMKMIDHSGNTKVTKFTTSISQLMFFKWFLTYDVYMKL